MTIKLDKLCIWIFIGSIALMLPSLQYVKVADELGCYLLGAIAFVDCVVNKQYRKYTVVFAFLIFFAFYIVYSIAFLNFNTTRFIITDAIIELKPFLPYLVIFAISPRFNEREKDIIKVLCYINVTACLILACLGDYYTELTLGHLSFLGTTCFICACTHMLLSIDSEGTLSKRDVTIIVVMLVIGLRSIRAKYFGEFILIMFFMFLYKPGMMKNFNFKHGLLIISVIATVIAASWNKISYYFITGTSDSFDLETLESFARPVLYATAGLIFVDFFPFGSGLASFASYASAQNYSGLYHYYGINNVWGLSEDFNEFICDAYYPCLAQFGIAGVVAFIIFFTSIYHHLRALIRYNSKHYKYHFVVGVSIIIFILIENIGGTVFVQSPGMLVMMLLGLTASLAHEPEVYQHSITHKKTFKIKI